MNPDEMFFETFSVALIIVLAMAFNFLPTAIAALRRYGCARFSSGIWC